MRFIPILRGVHTKTAKIIRHAMVGGCIYNGKLEVCDYRRPKIFDNRWTFRKLMGNIVSIMKSRFGQKEMNEQLNGGIQFGG